MEQPRPKFCVGEIVEVISEKFSEFTGKRAEVEKMEYINTAVVSAGAKLTLWVYQLKDLRSPTTSGAWSERSLRKVPPEERLSWDGMLGELEKPNREQQAAAAVINNLRKLRKLHGG